MKHTPVAAVPEVPADDDDEAAVDAIVATTAAFPSLTLTDFCPMDRLTAFSVIFLYFGLCCYFVGPYWAVPKYKSCPVTR